MDHMNDLSLSQLDLGGNNYATDLTAGQASTAGTTSLGHADGLQAQDKGTRKVPKLFHKKSRNGCQRCRARRVKCNEATPACQHCQRHKLPCIYDRPKAFRAESSGTKPQQNPSPRVDTKSSKSDTPDLPETRSRRLQELRLFHHYMTKSSLTVLGSTDSLTMDIWRTQVPRLAFDNEALLYSLYAFSAMHLWKDPSSAASSPSASPAASSSSPASPDNNNKNTNEASSFTQEETLSLHQKYLDLSIRHHRNDIQHLSPKNADQVCLTSTFIRMAAFVQLQDRQLQPYTPPLQWLQTTSGAKSVFAATWKWISEDEGSVIMAQLERTKILSGMGDFMKVTRQEDLVGLLRRGGEDKEAGVDFSEAGAEPWDRQVEDAYAAAINYLGSARDSVRADPEGTCRRLIVFPMVVDGVFIRLVGEARPRALVVMAHYFGLLSLFRGLWWMGDIGAREVRGVESVVSEEWKDLMRWPLDAIEQETLM